MPDFRHFILPQLCLIQRVVFGGGGGTIVRRILGLFLLLMMPRIAGASENLIENLRNNYNAVITDGVVHQVDADPRLAMQWKFQTWYSNDKHQLAGTGSYEAIWDVWDSRLGFISYTFTTPDDLDDLLYFRFGLNGDKIDTTVIFDIKNIQPNTTYTLQWRLLNNTQGEVSWDNMFLTYCATGMALPLGTTQCVPICPVGTGRLNMGDARYPLWGQKISTPALGIGYNGQVCYGHLASGAGAGLNVNFNGAVYHLID